MQQEKDIILDKIRKVLENFKEDFLKENSLYFAGGSSLSLKYDNFRLSRDIDFLSNNQEGFFYLRDYISTNGFLSLFKDLKEIEVKNIKINSYKIIGFVEYDKEIIKIEFLRNIDFNITKIEKNKSNIYQLSDEEMFKQKLSANIDRGMDKNFYSKDFVDLIILIKNNNNIIPLSPLEEIINIYGRKSLINSLTEHCLLLERDNNYKEEIFKVNNLDENLKTDIPDLMKNYLLNHLLNPEEKEKFIFKLENLKPSSIASKKFKF